MTRRKTTEEFIEEANDIHDYTYQYTKVIYINNNTKVIITCMIHGDFEQTPHAHLHQKQGCPKCGVDLRASNRVLTTEWFIKKANDRHRFRYDYSKTKYVNSKKKVIITCRVHGDFKQTPNNHLRGNGCPDCNSSSGESLVANYLKDRGIVFERQKALDGCTDKIHLRFDFYLPNHNCVIEYQGRQHYKVVSFFGGIAGLNDRRRKDKIKKEYCKVNKIRYITIKYTVKDVYRFLLDLGF